MSDATQMRPEASGWQSEAKSTLVLAWPLILAQLAQIGLGTTDVIMMSWLGPQHLAAGGLATSIMFFFLIFRDRRCDGCVAFNGTSGWQRRLHFSAPNSAAGLLGLDRIRDDFGAIHSSD